MDKQFSNLSAKVPQEYRISILVVFIFVIAGVFMNYFLGYINFSDYKYPVNVFIFCILIISLIIFSFFRKRGIHQLITGVPFTIILLSTLLICSLIIGLIPQITENIDFKNKQLHSFLDFRLAKNSWVFVLVYLLLLLTLGALILRRLIPFSKKNYIFYLIHIGIWLILVAFAMESTDKRLYFMPIEIGDTEWRIYSKENTLTELPIAINIKDFELQWYEDKHIERVVVNTAAYTKDGGEKNANVEINKPLIIDNWFVYLHNYDCKPSVNPVGPRS